MQWVFRRICLALFMLPSVSWVLAEDPAATPANTEAKPTAKGVEFFESKIRPVLAQRCFSCHSSQAKEVKGGLLLDTRDGLRKGGESGSAVVPGDPAESLIVQAIKHETYEMPPGDRLPDSVIADFEAWVRMGAPDPRTGAAAGSKKVSLAEARSYWAFQRPVKADPPATKDNAWPRTAIDRFVLAKLEQNGLHPVADADRATLARRLYYDLIGLPPTPDQLDQFLQDRSPEAVANLVDHLLDSPQFGERWGRHWLDVARYGESSGKERNVLFPYAWRYRDYVIDSFNQDKPYDRFIREQVAGDLLKASSADERRECLVATGFLALGTKSLNERNREQYLMDVADEQIDVTTRAVLGMTVACARCHDHKFDPISQTDYYAVAGVFRSTEVLAGVRPGNNKSGYEGEYARMAAEGTKGTITDEQQAEIDRLTEEIQSLKARKATGLAAVKSKAKAAKKANAEKVQKALERADERIATLESQLKSLRTQGPSDGAPVMAVRDAANPANCRVNIRGEVKDLGPEVPRGVPVVLSFDRLAKFDTTNSGRSQLAAWLVSRENPLTARVMVNRIWAHLLGRGIVESVDNFGTLGDDATHPELLDYLAVRFVEQGWSIKSVIKEITLSRTYQMASVHDAAGYAADPDNRLLWRMNRRRLEAEIVRDAILAVGGQLDLKRPAGSLLENAGAVEIARARVAVPDLDKFFHRSIYLPYVRSRMPDVLTVFDAADPSLIVGQREVTTVAPQALFMMNSRLVIERSRDAARRVLSEAPADDPARLDLAFRLILGRLPTAEQRERSLEYLRDLNTASDSGGGGSGGGDEQRTEAWASLCQSLIASGEFRYVY